MVNGSRWAAAVGVLVAISPLVASCASSGAEPTAHASASREAALRASHLCILNGTDKTIPMIRELEPFNNDDHHPDPAGPLAPGEKWCTNGYSSYGSNATKNYFDVTAQILFAPGGSDLSNWGVNNDFLAWPAARYGTGEDSTPFPEENTFETRTSWETDVTLPKNSTHSHDYHIRRLDDTEFFKEWLITVRR